MKTKFKAWDIINDKPIKLFKILISTSGAVIAVEDLDGEIYGMHQAKLTIDDISPSPTTVKANNKTITMWRKNRNCTSL